jgi:putative transposase
MAGKGRRRHTDEQILSILAEHQGGVTVQEIIRRHGISLDTFYRWKKTFSGVSKHDVQRLRALEDENARLKRMVADQALNLQVLKDALGKGW